MASYTKPSSVVRTYLAYSLVGVAAVMAILSPWLGSRWALASGAISLAVIALATVYAVVWVSSATCWLGTIAGWLGIIAGGATDRDSQRINQELMKQANPSKLQ